MKIGIDARIYGPKHGGIGRYVQQLLKQIDTLQTNDQFVVFMMQSDYDDIQFNSEHIKKVVANIAWYSLEEQVKLTKIIKQQDIDLMHFTHWNVPLNYNDTFIVTIHDLIMYHFSRKEATTKSFLTYKIKDATHKLVVKHAVKKAKHIIAISQFTKQDIIKTLNVAKNKISVIYQGLTELHNDKKTNNTNKYILYVGSAYPHKNVNKLMEAFNLFTSNKSRQKNFEEIKLIIAGKQDRFFERLKNSEAYRLSNNIECKLGASDDELSELYAGAHAFVFPSLYEGFGLPPIEAMQFHLPVLSSSSSCLPEVLGEAALFVDATDVHSFAHAIDQIVFNQEIRAEVVSNIYQELKRYSWKKCATETVAMYHNL